VDRSALPKCGASSAGYAERPKLQLALPDGRASVKLLGVTRPGPMERIRRICLALPEAYEEETWGAATFRVRKKIFVMAADHEGRKTVTMKATREEQQALLALGEPYFFPAYVGAKGWIGVDLAATAVRWAEVADLVRESYCLVAPKRLAAQVD
jgi:predicted DNA-binding protein (MmcQ/YjbR family)